MNRLFSSFVVAVFLLATPRVARATGTHTLAAAMAAACLGDAACRAKYVVGPGDDLAKLTVDVEYLVLAHGFSDDDLCVALAASAEPVLIGLALAMSAGCADPEALADTKATVFTTGAAAAVLLVALSAYLGLFTIIAARSSPESFARLFS